jgi:hypothetical protein
MYEQSQNQPWQFRMRSLFVFTAVTAVLLSAFMASSDDVRSVICSVLLIALPIAAASAAFHGHGYLRTFAIGAFIPSLATVWGGAGLVVAELATYLNPQIVSDPGLSRDNATRGLYSLGAAAIVYVLAGFTAMLVRWLVEPARREMKQAGGGGETQVHVGMEDGGMANTA